jgi:hypothetical protein
MRVDRNQHGIHIHQSAYIDEIATEFCSDDLRREKYPAVIGLKLDQHLNDELVCCPIRLEKYQSIVGKLLYTIQCTRLDIAFITTQLSRYTRNPSQYHLDAALHVIRYLRTTKHLGLRYYTAKQPDIIRPILTADTDADYSNDKDSKSISGHLAQLINQPENDGEVTKGNIIIFNSSKQKCCTISTAESEYVAANKCARTVVWMRNLLNEIGFPQDAPTVIYGDNIACIYMTEAEHITQRTRHIEQQYNWIKEKVEDKIVVLEYRPGLLLTADCLTKNLTGELFSRHRNTVFGEDVTKSNITHM